ncbi:hypothetical protein BV25DRAFT_1823028 [Artomyces pyxidatus]|uniref:Uncharacterized protein n=1 Tax=Artomyces pyxidatus TaxID=48021 RepID=A0ACB8T776_9AGAM|nr:hypothetical protein BV25DRAFT_1823028 [Artomyces pyxidatus]
MFQDLNLPAASSQSAHHTLQPHPGSWLFFSESPQGNRLCLAVIVSLAILSSNDCVLGFILTCRNCCSNCALSGSHHPVRTDCTVVVPVSVLGCAAA